MTAYTVSTYQYSNAAATPGYSVITEHSSLTVTSTGSIVTGPLAAEAVYINASYDTLLVNGTVTSMASDGVDVLSYHAGLTINGHVEGYTDGILLSGKSNNFSITVGATGQVIGDQDDGIDLTTAYGHLTVNGSVETNGSYHYAIYASDVHDTITIGATGSTNDGVGVSGDFDTVTAAGTVAGTQDGILLGGHHDSLTVSGHVSGYNAVDLAGGYNTARITGTLEANGGNNYSAALELSGYEDNVTIGPRAHLEGTGYGITLAHADSDSVINNGAIAGYGMAVYLSGNSSIVNHGTMSGGIYVDASIGITLDNTGTIDTPHGIYANSSALEIDNSGSVQSDLAAYDTLTGPAPIDPGLTIHNSGTWHATEISAQYETFTLINTGTIDFVSGYGGGLDKYLGLVVDTGYGQMTIDNQATGLIEGDTGAALYVGIGTVDNAGTIDIPVNFYGTLVNESTGVMNGTVVIYEGSVTNYGNISGSVVGGANAGDVVVNHGTIGRVVFQSAGTLYNYGTISGHITGSAGNDVLLSGGSSAVWINGSAGNDIITTGSGNDTIQGGSGTDVIKGGGGNDSIDGGFGHDVISGGTGDDSLTGGSGNDAFAFAAGFGKDVITDFTAGAAIGHDVIHFLTGTFANFSDVESAMTVNGSGNVVITLDSGDTITLTGVHSTGDLVSQDFQFG